jgi:hypothetical protein
MALPFCRLVRLAECVVLFATSFVVALFCSLVQRRSWIRNDVYKMVFQIEESSVSADLHGTGGTPWGGTGSCMSGGLCSF